MQKPIPTMETPRFFMYDEPALDFGWLSSCARFEKMQRGSMSEWMGEVEIRNVLAIQPQRTRVAAEAELFFVPIWECAQQSVQIATATLASIRRLSSPQQIPVASSASATAPRTGSVWRRLPQHFGHLCITRQVVAETMCGHRQGRAL